MQCFFHDPVFSFELLRTLGHAVYGGADIGECLVVAARIREGDFESWTTEWGRMAEQVEGYATTALAQGHPVSAREAFLRASNYYRTAEFFLHEYPGDPRILSFSRASRTAFLQAARLFVPPFEAVEIPFEGTSLPGYFYCVDDAPEARPTLIFHGGLDSTVEELYFAGAAAALRRGYNVLTFDGPGQGRVIREQGLPLRPNWETVVTPVVDYALMHPEVKQDAIVLMGWSLGGYLAARAAAFETRLAALITCDGVYDLSASGPAYVQMSDEGFRTQVFAEQAPDLDRRLEELGHISTTIRWAWGHGMWAYGVRSPREILQQGFSYTLEGLADRIRCPTLVCEAEADRQFEGQPQRLFDALTCPKTYLRFTSDEGAEEHCHLGAQLRFHQRAFDWLDTIVSSR